MVTVVLLVALRVTIGCHFFYEGVWKIADADKFSAEPFLTMAKGPAAPLFYAMIYDLNGRERLKVENVASAEALVASWAKVRSDAESRYRANLQKVKKDSKTIDAAAGKFREATMPLLRQSEVKLQAALEANEEDLAACFVGEKDGDRVMAETVTGFLSKIGAVEQDYLEALKAYAEKDLDAKDAVARSAVAVVPKVDKDAAVEALVVNDSRPNPDGVLVLDVTIRNPALKKDLVRLGPGMKAAVTLAAWDQLRQDMVGKYGLDQRQQAQVLDVFRQHEAGLRQYLANNMADIAGYLGSLDRFETEQSGGNNGAAFQKERTWNRMMALRSEAKQWLSDIDRMEAAYRWSLWQVLNDDQRELGDLPRPWTFGKFMDFAVTWGLTAIGVCLLLGFCTRLASLGGAAFLVSVLLTQPPWPTVYPPAPEVVGHSLVVDKNFVEMVAMLVLASTAVGRWGGLDHFVYRFVGEPLVDRLRLARNLRKK